MLEQTEISLCLEIRYLRKMGGGSSVATSVINENEVGGSKAVILNRI